MKNVECKFVRGSKVSSQLLPVSKKCEGSTKVFGFKRASVRFKIRLGSFKIVREDLCLPVPG